MGLSEGGAYLVRRRDGWSFRIPVPFPGSRKIGRVEIMRRLGTSNPKVARLLEAWFKAELDLAWRSFESGALTDQAVLDGMDGDDCPATAL